MVFAIDFDGTLSLGEWPFTGPANMDLIEYLLERRAAGDRLILWTCREGAELQAAVRFCLEHGLHFDAVNDNLPENIEKYGGNSRKICCDYYIDDRAVQADMYRKIAIPA